LFALVYPGVYFLGDYVAKLSIKAGACVDDEALHFIAGVGVVAKVGF
jgi:hypothetical protein